MTEQQRYRSFLLRLWYAAGDGGAWRAQLVDPRTGERLGFSTLAALVAFLEHEFGGGEAAESVPDEARRDGAATALSAAPVDPLAVVRSRS